MSRTVYCAKLKKELPALLRQPYPGELGKKIFNEISEEAWKQWLAHQIMLLNEYRLSAIDPKARDFLKQEMENFLFKEGSAKPSGYVPEK